MENFISLGILPTLAEKLAGRSISRPTAVQRMVIPPLLSGKKIIFRSATGTGKTFAYLLPALHRLLADIAEPAGSDSGDSDGSNTAASVMRYCGPHILICAPTFELCAQIKAEADFLSSVPSSLLIGSVSLNRQIESLKKTKPLIAVGNPGRLLVLAKMGKLKLHGLRFLVLDEADRMTAAESLAETGELIRLIARNLHGRELQKPDMAGGFSAAACSATVSGKTGELLLPLFEGAELLETDEQEILREQIEHWAIFSENRRKIQTLRALLAAIKTRKTGFKALVFAGRNDEAGKIVSQLQYHHIPAAGLFGTMDKKDRKDAVASFRSGKLSVLISSDLAARGLDIPGISHVIALDVPADKEIYIHRAGRTGRAGRRGIMVSIGDEEEMRRLAALEKKLGIAVHPRELYQGAVESPLQNEE
ncbi:DEAD/DEAH box helicase [Spirochaetia bacterium]|nr:DEAD/DEAH box helicase [Spirochaetia bacterium]